MPENHPDKLCINVNVIISAASLQGIVASAKRSAPKNPNGTYHIDMADQVSEVISRFLEEHHFDDYIQAIADSKPGST